MDVFPWSTSVSPLFIDIRVSWISLRQLVLKLVDIDTTILVEPIPAFLAMSCEPGCSSTHLSCLPVVFTFWSRDLPEAHGFVRDELIAPSMSFASAFSPWWFLARVAPSFV